MIFEGKRTLSALEECISTIKKLPADIKDNSIILIGTEETSKSALSKLLVDRTRGRIGSEDKEQLSSILKKEANLVIMKILKVCIQEWF